MDMKLDQLRAEFISPGIEQGFRENIKVFTQTQLVFGLTILALPVLAFAKSDYILFGPSPQLWQLYAVRGGTLLIAAVLISLVLQSKRSLNLDLPVLLALVTFSLVILYINHTRPPDFHQHSIIDILILLSYYFLVPNRFLYQCLSALVMTACAIVTFQFFRDPPSALGSNVFWLSYFVANVLGIWYAHHLHLVNRQRYRLLVEQQETSRALEQALGEVKTLEGILPICANCKKIRESDGYWKQVEAYIESHSTARVSHGLCEDCMQELYGIEFAPGNAQDTGAEQSQSTE